MRKLGCAIIGGLLLGLVLAFGLLAVGPRLLLEILP